MGLKENNMIPTVMDDFKAKTDEAKVVGIIILIFIIMLTIGIIKIIIGG
jgi:hypothetical protein